MANGKRYYWLKLNEDFFNETYVKALRRLPSGDSLVIVYLKMQLKSLKTEGLLKYCGLLPDSTAELAMALDEDENIVRLTVEALIRFKLIERWEDETLYITAVEELTGSEGASAQRVRKFRQKCEKTQQIKQCNSDVLHCDSENQEIALHCNGEIEIELDIEKDIPPLPPAGDDGQTTPEFPGAEPKEHQRKPDVIGERFKSFWTAYPKKQGKGAAEKSFRKIRPSDKLLKKMLEAIELAKKCSQWQRDGGQYIPNPATWIKQKRWEDEYSGDPPSYNRTPNYGDDDLIPDF